MFRFAVNKLRILTWKWGVQIPSDVIWQPHANITCHRFTGDHFIQWKITYLSHVNRKRFECVHKVWRFLGPIHEEKQRLENGFFKLWRWGNSCVVWVWYEHSCRSLLFENWLVSIVLIALNYFIKEIPSSISMWVSCGLIQYCVAWLCLGCFIYMVNMMSSCRFFSSLYFI